LDHIPRRSAAGMCRHRLAPARRWSQSWRRCRWFIAGSAAAAEWAASRLFLLIASLGVFSAAVPAMDIEVQNNEVIMSGPVNGSECAQLGSILRQNAIGVVVLTNSHGGNADAGYCVGELIRQHRLATVIRGSCNSSCSRMWLGGVSRTLDGANSRVGLHSNYNRNGDLRSGAPARLRAWIPNYAPVNRELMEQWINLPENKQMMYFYNDRAKLCDHGRCSALPGWNARNAGLSTQ